MAEPPKERPPSFSLVRGGLIYRLERRFGLVRVEPPAPAFPVWGTALLAFAPLVVLAAVQGVLIGPQVKLPLALDLTVYARFLIAIPLLLRSEQNIDSRLAMAVAHLRTSGIVGEKARGKLEAAIADLERARDWVLPELLILAASILFGWINTHAIGLPVSSWRVVTPGLLSSTTLAGHWLDFVSQPLFNFLVSRWIWRIALWSIFLGRVSKLDLDLVPTHPDGAAGVGFMGEIHAVFGAFLVPLSVTIAARGVLWVQYAGGTVDSFRNAAIAFAVIGLAITLGPLLVFMPKLLVTKRRGLLEYGGFALEYTRGFDRKWLRSPRTEAEPLLGTSDIQSLADLGNSYHVVRSMRVVPAGTRNAVTLALAIALPMVPFLAFIIPIKQILKLLLQFVAR